MANGVTVDSRFLKYNKADVERLLGIVDNTTLATEEDVRNIVNGDNLYLGIMTQEEYERLISLERLGDFFDELMKSEPIVGATNVNVELEGYVITVTDRYGQTVSQNIKGEKGDKGDTGYDIHLEDLTEEEKEILKNLLCDGLVFASEDTCRDIIGELV